MAKIVTKTGIVVYEDDYTSLNRIDLSNRNIEDLLLNDRYMHNMNFNESYLEHADFKGSVLSDCTFVDANLPFANFSYCHLHNVSFKNTYLGAADFRNAIIRSVNFESVITTENTVGLELACPEEGSFIGYKKCYSFNINENGEINLNNIHLVTLLIPEDAKRSSATTLKCRASKAKVIAISGGINEVCSSYNPEFFYQLGEIVEADSFDDNRWNECSNGIHFFMNKRIAYYYC